MEGGGPRAISVSLYLCQSLCRLGLLVPSDWLPSYLLRGDLVLRYFLVWLHTWSKQVKKSGLFWNRLDIWPLTLSGIHEQIGVEAGLILTGRKLKPGVTWVMFKIRCMQWFGNWEITAKIKGSDLLWSTTGQIWRMRSRERQTRAKVCCGYEQVEILWIRTKWWKVTTFWKARQTSLGDLKGFPYIGMV